MATRTTHGCAQVKPATLSEYIDGALAADEAWRVRTHLAVCPACASEAASLQRTSALVGQVTAPRARPGFEQRLAARLADSGATSAARRSWYALPRAIDGGFGRTGAASRRAWALAAGGGLALASCGLAGALLLFHAPAPRTRAVAPAPEAATGSPSDLAFIAACSSSYAQYGSSEAIADPSAQALAAHVDAARADDPASAPAPPAE